MVFLWTHGKKKQKKASQKGHCEPKGRTSCDGIPFSLVVGHQGEGKRGPSCKALKREERGPFFGWKIRSRFTSYCRSGEGTWNTTEKEKQEHFHPTRNHQGSNHQGLEGQGAKEQGLGANFFPDGKGTSCSKGGNQ